MFFFFHFPNALVVSVLYKIYCSSLKLEKQIIVILVTLNVLVSFFTSTSKYTWSFTLCHVNSLLVGCFTSSISLYLFSIFTWYAVFKNYFLKVAWNFFSPFLRLQYLKMYIFKPVVHTCSWKQKCLQIPFLDDKELKMTYRSSSLPDIKGNRYKWDF